MSFNSIRNNASVLRIIGQVQRLKWPPPFSRNLFCGCKAQQGLCDHASKITYTQSSVQSYSYEIQEGEKEHYLQDNFLKENFNIIDSRYFKLVTLPCDIDNLEALLWTDEFKKILSRSSFSYDVDVLECCPSFNPLKDDFHSVNASYTKVLCSKENISLEQQSSDDLDTVFASSSETKESGKERASEEQLLHIIDRLTYSLINFFEKPHDFSIYHKNIIFQNNIKGVTIKGLNAYAQSIYLMRLYGFLHFAKVKVEILKITHHIEDGTIRVRWRVNGIPRHQILVMLWKHKSLNWRSWSKDDTDWLDGFSIFSVGGDGLIFRHICDKMIPDDGQVRAKNVDLKSKVLGLLGLQPRAALISLMPCCECQDSLPPKKLT